MLIILIILYTKRVSISINYIHTLYPQFDDGSVST